MMETNSTTYSTLTVFARVGVQLIAEGAATVTVRPLTTITLTGKHST